MAEEKKEIPWFLIIILIFFGSAIVSLITVAVTSIMDSLTGMFYSLSYSIKEMIKPFFSFLLILGLMIGGVILFGKALSSMKEKNQKNN